MLYFYVAWLCILLFISINSISTSYYTSTVQYCFYCSSREGAKRPRASAVSKAILHSGRVVTSLSPILDSEPPPEAGG